MAGGRAVMSANLVDRTSYPRINTLPLRLFSRINTLPLRLFSRINTLPTSALSHTGRGFAGILPVCIPVCITCSSHRLSVDSRYAPTHNRLGPPPNTNINKSPNAGHRGPFKAIWQIAIPCSGRWQR